MRFSMPGSRCRPTPVCRAAFTLIELLVAITIFALLATIAIGSFTERGNDRIPAAARQLRSVFAGAQSRAARDGVPRGVRLVPDPVLASTGALITSVVYIGSNTDVEGVLDDQTLPSPVSKTVQLRPGTSGGWVIQQKSGDTIQWDTLRTNTPATLLTGQRVKLTWPQLPGGTFGRSVTYTIASFPGTRQMTIVGPEPPPSLAGNPRFQLELAPEVLENVEPIALPRGTVIDLDASVVPAAFRTNPYTSIDIMFSPRGEVIGPLSTAGLLHFYVGDLEDSQIAITTRPPMSPPVLLSDVAVLRPRRVVSLFPATGQIVPTEYVDNTFALPGQGSEAK